MKTVNQLFRFRLKHEWLYHYRVWKTAVDWIVWVYILLPALVGMMYYYFLLWEGSIQWPHVFPVQLLLLLFFFYSWTGTVRFFWQEGDLLFLRQHSSWLFGLMKQGFIYTTIRNGLATLLLGACFLPIWITYEQASLNDVVLFLFFVFFYQFSIQLARQLLSIRFQRWKLLLAQLSLILFSFAYFCLFLIDYPFVQWILLVVTIVISFQLLKTRVSLTSSFFQDCLRENQERLKLASMFVGASGYKMNKRQRKKPLILFWNSAPLFKTRSSQNIISEVYIKRTIRNKTTLYSIFRITGISIGAILLTPIWLKWILLIVFLLAIVHYIRSGWKEVSSHSFFKLFPYNEHEQTVKGMKKAIFLLAMPSCFVLGLVTGWSVYSFLVGIGVGVVTVLVAALYVRDIWL